MDILPLYTHRFDPVYLTMLSELLKIENLKATALDQIKTINEVEYCKCISIDFCGIAATTLFGTELDRPENTTENIAARRNVAATFKKLFEKQTLEKLNNEGYYLKVRFCLSYLYSDFPICLIKAEQADTWTNLADKPVDSFYINQPLSEQEFRNSNLRRAQEHSLIKISEIVRNNPDIIIGGKEKKINTIQVRFPAIPSPVCTLMINEIALSDPYMYAKMDAESPLSLSFPVVVLKKYGEDHKQNESFLRVLRHFNYLWRHDMTLFSGDASNFTSENPQGIITVLHPGEVVGNGGKNWRHKEKRIRDKIVEIANVNKTLPVIDEDQVNSWKLNLTLKFKRSTRKIDSLASPLILKSPGANTKTAAGHHATVLTLGLRRKTYFFNIRFNSLNQECEWLGVKPTVLYYTLAHFAYAKLDPENRRPILHKIYKNSNGLREQLIGLLKNAELGRETNGPEMFNQLFDKDFNFKVPAEDIILNEIESIAEVRYEYAMKINKMHHRQLHTGFISCLDYQIPALK